MKKKIISEYLILITVFIFIFNCIGNKQRENLSSEGSKSAMNETELINQLNQIQNFNVPQEISNIYYEEVNLFTQNIYTRFDLESKEKDSLFSLNRSLFDKERIKDNPFTGWTFPPVIKKWWQPERLTEKEGYIHLIKSDDYNYSYYILIGKNIGNNPGSYRIYLMYVSEVIEK